MGARQKIINSWRYCTLSVLMVLAFFVMTIGFGVVDFGRVITSNLNFGTAAANSGEIDRYWVDLRSDSIAQTDVDQNGKTVWHIRTPAELAYMNYAITHEGSSGSTTDYSENIYVLENDINLNDLELNIVGETVFPYWTPIDIGNRGKNKNIKFNGNGYKIKGMRIKCDPEDTSSILNAGFFANMIGGTVENVIFENPEIVYEYVSASISENDPDRPRLPTDICIGVVAGEADSTYIHNVEITNPRITFTSIDVNAHNFYVGTAVGKLSNTTVFDSNNRISTINTMSPKKWGIDTVDINKTTIVNSSHITVNINHGHSTADTYGKATSLYFGGLVGANISSKIINSTLRDLSVTPNIADNVEGACYVGGLVGLSTQVAGDEHLIVAAGLYNNLLIDVNLGSITTTGIDKRYCGNLIGRVYAGGWVYNNIIVGGTMPYNHGTVDVNTVAYEKLWEQVTNSATMVCNDEHCVSHINGTLDPYFFDEQNNYIGDLNCVYTSSLLFEEPYVFCNTHQRIITLNSSAQQSEMIKYNFHFTGWDDPAYASFLNTPVYTPQAGDPLSKFQLVSSIIENGGYAYYAARGILQYEKGLTIPTDEENVSIEEEERAFNDLLAAVNQFRVLQHDNDNNELYLGDYFGKECPVIFKANDDDHPKLSTAYFEVENNWGSTNLSPDDYVENLTFQEIIRKPSDPVCEGYEFKGWRIKGWDQDGSNITDCPYKTYLDPNGAYYIFDRERILEPGRVFVAIWEVKKYSAAYMVREYSQDGQSYEDVPFANYPTEDNIPFGGTLKGPIQNPTSNQGYAFVGWFLENNLPEYGENANADLQWQFGQNGATMGVPENGNVLYLYAGWIDNFTMLRALLEDIKYIEYSINYAVYFNDTTGQNFKNAYDDANEALIANDATNANALLDNLKNTYAALRVDPKKLLNLPAFDESKTENSCPFLYDYNAYLSYITFKKTVEKYANADADDEVLSNIEGYIKNYETIIELFDALKNNLKNSVEVVGGVQSKEVQDLIKQYQDLEASYEELYRTEEYIKYDLDALVAIKERAEELWTKVDGVVVLADVKSAINDYAAALNNLQPKNVTVDEEESTGEKEKIVKTSSGSGISPIILGIIIVSILGVGVIGYIGVDVIVNKHRAKINAQNAKSKRKRYKDDETYV